MVCKFYSEWERSNPCWALCVPWRVLCEMLCCVLCCLLCCVRCCKFDSKSLRSNQWGVAPPCQVTCWCPLSATSPLFTSSTSSPICLLNLCSHLVLADTASFKKWIVLLNEYSGFKKNEFLYWMNILDFWKMNICFEWIFWIFIKWIIFKTNILVLVSPRQKWLSANVSNSS